MTIEVCRLCLASENYINIEFKNIFSDICIDGDKNLRCVDAIMDCTSLQINEDDQFPKLVCENCIKKLEVSYTFRKTCLESDYKLKSKFELCKNIKKEETVVVEEFSANLPTSHVNNLEKSRSVSEENLVKLINGDDVSVKNEYNEEKEEASFMDDNCDDSDDFKITCGDCGCIFNTENELNTHINEHLDKRLHIKQKQKVDNKYNCTLCNVDFKSQNAYEKHMETHFERPYICEFDNCSKAFKKKAHLIVHRRIHTGNTPYNCKICLKKCITNGQLRKHVKKQHPDDYVESVKEIIFTCSYCKESFGTKQKLEEHVTNRICKKQAKRSKGPFFCSHCNKKFESSPSLKNHMRLHSGERPFVCETCGKSFKQSAHLNTHKKVHSGEKMFMCEICSKSYITNSALKRHMFKHVFPFNNNTAGAVRMSKVKRKDNNGGEKKFFCKICPRGFKRSESYEQHLRVHSGESPYMCEQCGACFKQLSSLRMHKLLHRGEKPHQCVVCSKAFITAAELKVHSVSHTNEFPHKCTKCDKQFKYRITLWRHEMYHTGEKPHKCSVCGKAFLEAGPLRRHMRVHTGERPNQCKLCYKAFKEKTHLKTHMKVHKSI